MSRFFFFTNDTHIIGYSYDVIGRENSLKNLLTSNKETIPSKLREILFIRYFLVSSLTVVSFFFRQRM